jgi:phage terminase large subunit-like protein
MSKVKFVDNMPLGLSYYLACDLAFGDKDTNDFSAFVVLGLDKDGRWYVEAHQGRFLPSESAEKIIELVSKYNILEVGIEQGGSYIAVKEHLDKLQLDYQVWFSIKELKHGGKSKLSRVKALEPIVSRSLFNIVTQYDAETLVEQMELTTREAILSAHDDILDGVAYLTSMVPTYYGSNEPNLSDYYEEEYDDEDTYGGSIFIK